MNERKKFNWPGWLVFGVTLLVWELGARGMPQLQLYFPPISQILAALAQAISSGAIAQHCAITVGRFLQGYLIAAALAVTLGVLLGYFRFLHGLLATVIELLRPMPSVSAVPPGMNACMAVT